MDIVLSKLNIDEEFRSLIPPLKDEEYAGLEASILADGCRDSLVVLGDTNTIVDGHNRYEICTKHHIGFKVLYKDFADRGEAKIWIIRNQFGRRNLNLYQRSKLALELKPLIAQQAKKNQLSGLKQFPDTVPQNSAKRIETREELAKAASVSHDTISKVEKIEAKAEPEQKEALRTGKVSINKVYRDIKREENREGRMEELKLVNLDSVQRRYPVMYADPPWRYEHSETKARKIENQYPTMTLDDIKELDISSIANDNCLLFLWATSPKLAEAMDVIEAWGFTYRTCMVWVKDKIGMGYYARQRHELLLIANKGSVPPPEPSARPDSVLESPRQKHSQKPDGMYEIIERMYPDLPKIELFARAQREGWDSWGNEI